MTQFKVRARGHRERASVGLFNYPALMAADILLYDAKLVPVGADQRQHVEVTRDVAQRINRRFGNLLTIPEADVGAIGSRIMALDDPSEKMSKTTASSRPNHAIAILDSPDSITRKLSRSVTDSRPTVAPPYAPGVTNLIEIYRSVTDLSLDAVTEELSGSKSDTPSSEETTVPW
jgi:tryptophanyl-tRNA synthetase